MSTPTANKTTRPGANRYLLAVPLCAALVGGVTPGAMARPGAAAAAGKAVQGDVSREGLCADKALQLVRLLRPKNTRTLARVDRFASLASETCLARLEQRQGRPVRGWIVDVDECISPHHGEILPENLAAIDRMLARGCRFAVLSNARATDRLDLLRSRGIAVITHRGDGRPVAPKPAVQTFVEAARALQRLHGIDPAQVVMVGDNYLTDGGAIRAGLGFIKVKPVPTPHTRGIGRIVQRSLRGITDGVARLHDRFRRPGRRALHLDRR